MQPSLTSNSTKEALIQISQLLNRDVTTVTPIPTPTSEGEKIKTNGAQKPTNHHATKRLTQMTNMELDKLIESFKRNDNTNVPPTERKNKIMSQLPISYSIPTPKATFQHNNQQNIPSRPIPTLGRPRLPNYQYATATKCDATKHLVQNTAQINHIFDQTGKVMSIDELLKGVNAEIWATALSNELGRLAQGINNIKGNDAIDFISREDVPTNKVVTYARMVCDIRPFKAEQYRVRLTVGGDRLMYPDDSSSPAASLLESKLLLNSTISQSAQGCRFLTLDIKDFFLQTLMTSNEYMRIHNKYFIGAIRQKYKIDKLIAKDGYVYCRIKKGMYGLRQAARLAYDDLKQHLRKYGYMPDPIAPNIWKHETRKTKFCLCVDDFGVQYFSDSDAQHLISALKAKYDITVDKKGENFCGLNLKWNYTHGYVDISMPQYVQNTLRKLNYKTTIKRQLAPHKWQIPAYGKKRQMATPEDTTTALDNKQIKYVQKAVGCFLYYARAVDNTILPTLNEIALQQARPTQTTLQKIQMLFDYLNTYPNAKIRFYASDMKLYIDSDAAYLIAPKAKSRIAGFYYLSNISNESTPKPKLNGPVLVECKLLNHVVTSAAEAETAGLFCNAQYDVNVINILNALGRPQGATPIKTDNATAASFVVDTIKNKRSKSWDVRYHWLSEQQNKGKFNIYWDRGRNNLADYHTKHHPPSYHEKVRPTYILKNFLLKLYNNVNTATMHRRPLPARVCSYPISRRVRTNVPDKSQRTTSRYPAVGSNAKTRNIHHNI